LEVGGGGGWGRESVLTWEQIHSADGPGEDVPREWLVRRGGRGGVRGGGNGLVG
jgi:hypothetical protein